MSDSSPRHSSSSVSCCSKNSPSLNSWIPLRKSAGGGSPQASAAYGPPRRFFIRGKLGASVCPTAGPAALGWSGWLTARSPGRAGGRSRRQHVEQHLRQRERDVLGHDGTLLDVHGAEL